MAGNMVAGQIAYFEGDFVPVEEAKVSILTHTFNYGTGIFEGIRGYHCGPDEGVLIFRLQEHIDRLVRNTSVMCMDLAESPEKMLDVCIELVKQSGFDEGVYIRPICYKSELSLGPKLHDVESSFCCYLIKLGDYVDVDSGLDVSVSSWRRLSDNSIPSRVKATGGYLNSSLASSEAKQGGFDEAIFLREDGTVAEGSAMNVFMVLNGELVTPPPTADILVGITRNTVMELAQAELGLSVLERPISRSELYVCDELFFAGTGAQVAPIRSVDRRLVGDGTPGAISKRLQALYFDVVHGKMVKYKHWCTPVL
jgi:branched-chain amino acid aminotransferase